jgi:G:T/U-mismatch repair DNA glycosylase
LASDLLKPGLELVLCGYNPSLASGRSGHHYAHPGNRFWRVLFAAGITGRLYMPEEDARLLEENRHGFGQGVYGLRHARSSGSTHFVVNTAQLNS